MILPLLLPFTLPLNISSCTKSGCTPVRKRVALDAASNHTSPAGQELVSVSADGGALTLRYGGPSVGGPRVYLIEDTGTDANTLFMLRNREFTFDVELSSLPCGFNAALYFVGMKANAGSAQLGTGYCDAQAVGGTFCSEMDVLEANTWAPAPPRPRRHNPPTALPRAVWRSSTPPTPASTLARRTPPMHSARGGRGCPPACAIRTAAGSTPFATGRALRTTASTTTISGTARAPASSSTAPSASP